MQRPTFGGLSYEDRKRNQQLRAIFNHKQPKTKGIVDNEKLGDCLGKKNVLYYEETLRPAEEVLKFLFEGDNIKLARSVAAKEENKPLILAVSNWKFAYANSTSSLSRFLIGRGKTGSRITAKVCDKLGVKKVGTDSCFSILGPDGEYIIKDYSYSDPEEDLDMYKGLILDRMKAMALSRGGVDLFLDKGMEKYLQDNLTHLTADEGVATLTLFRLFREQLSGTEKLLKRSLSITPTMPCTLFKFMRLALILGPDALVLFYGSGPVEKMARHAFRRVYCVDPAFDGPKQLGFKGTHTEYHKALMDGTEPDIKPDHICSDAVQTLDTDVPLSIRAGNASARARLRHMDLHKTNKISAEVHEFWINNGYTKDFELVTGATEQLPVAFGKAKCEHGYKSRPGNAEVIALVKNAASSEVKTVKEVLSAKGGNIHLSNMQRLAHGEEGTFPVRDYVYPDYMEYVCENIRQNTVIRPLPKSGGRHMMDRELRRKFYQNADQEDDEATPYIFKEGEVEFDEDNEEIHPGYPVEDWIVYE